MIFQDYADQPREVSIETLAICNAACTFCPYPTIKRKGHKMPNELLNRLIDEMATFEKPFCFSPFKVSDPLLDKRLPKILARMSNEVPLARVRIFTNGSALNAEKAGWLHSATNLELFISLNEYRAKEHLELMGLDFDRVTRNIDELHGSNFRHPVHVLKVGYDRQFAEYVTRRWPRFTPLLIKKDGWLGFTEADQNTPTPKCYRWLELSIMATGVVALCCMDAEGRYAIGDVNEEPMLDIYRRWTHRHQPDRAGITPCAECTY